MMRDSSVRAHFELRIANTPLSGVIHSPLKFIDCLLVYLLLVAIRYSHEWQGKLLNCKRNYINKRNCFHSIAIALYYFHK